jgi:hypothetical protein
MSKILEDASRKPQAFCWFGAIPDAEIQDWLNQNHIRLPLDLVELWRRTGGGDVFESETILRPNVPSVPAKFFVTGDDTDSANAAHRSSGLAKHLYVFQFGAFLSAVDLRTMEYVTLSEADSYSITSRFASLDDWYQGSLRAEFGSRYALD